MTEADQWRIPVRLPDGRVVKMRKCDLRGSDMVAFIDGENLPPAGPMTDVPPPKPPELSGESPERGAEPPELLAGLDAPSPAGSETPAAGKL